MTKKATQTFPKPHGNKQNFLSYLYSDYKFYLFAFYSYLSFTDSPLQECKYRIDLTLIVVTTVTMGAVSTQVAASEVKTSKLTLSHAMFKWDPSSLVRTVPPIDNNC